jgi:RNA polymerase sigma-70 factor (ECF subfamily)
VRHDLRSRFEAEAVPYLEAVFNFARRLTGQDEPAKDLAQDAFLRAYTRFHTFTPGTNCRAWLFTITYSLFVNQYHRGRRDPQLTAFDEEEFVADASPGAHGTSTPARAAAAADIEAALARLPDEYRAAVSLVDMERLSYEEAAAVLGCPVGTIRSRLFRARKHLAASLRDYDVARRRDS